jgi:hypothetical protein
LPLLKVIDSNTVFPLTDNSDKSKNKTHRTNQSQSESSRSLQEASVDN